MTPDTQKRPGQKLPPLSPMQRARVVALWRSGVPFVAIAKTLGINTRTAQKVVAAWRDEP